jgi:hypothetical protein
MMRKARLAIRKVNVALDGPGYYFGTGRSLVERIGVKKCSRSFPRSKKMGSYLNSEGIREQSGLQCFAADTAAATPRPQSARAG